MLARAERALARWPKPAMLLLAFGGVCVIGLLDYASGYEVSLSIFYLLPVALATWYLGRSAGAGIGLLSCVAWLAADFGAGHVYSHPEIPFWNALVRLGFFLVTVGLLDGVHARLALEHARASTDPLTGLLNGRAFAERLGQHFALARRERRALTIAYVDLDDFKRINDRFGHAEGDRALRMVARVLVQGLRETDVAARLGGDEFALLLPAADAAGAREVIGKLRRRLQRPSAPETPAVACSVGAITFLEPPAKPGDAITLADRLMYEVKARGKNGVAFRSVGADGGAGAPLADAGPGTPGSDPRA